MSEFLHDDNNDNVDTKAIAIPQVFLENSPANKYTQKLKDLQVFYIFGFRLYINVTKTFLY